MSSRGVTVVELLVTIVVVSVIASFALISVKVIIDNTKEKADLNNLQTLNKATQNYVAHNNIVTADAFEGISIDYDRIDKLLETGFIDIRVTPKQNGASFGWNIANQEWELFVNGNPYNDFESYDFEKMTLDDAIADGLQVPNENWVSYNEDEGYTVLERQSGMLLKETYNDEYSFSVLLSTQNQNDTRPVFLFDYNDEGGNLAKGEGFAILFNRKNAFVRIFTINNGTSYSNATTFYYSSTGIIPTIQTDPNWYAEEHTMRFVISRVNTTTKEIEIYIDGDFLKSFQYNRELTNEPVYYGPNVRGNGSEIYVHDFD